MSIVVKICGLRTPEAVGAAVEGGAALVGFVFFPRSPRFIPPAEAGALAGSVPRGVGRVGLVVDADDATIAGILERVPLDWLQLHGHESPERVAAVTARFGLPVIKAVGIAAEDDVCRARTFEEVADRLLFDARPPRGADRPGGNARAFDWSLLAGRSWRRPWLLAGGLTPDNLAEAVHATGAEAVDVSSGVEDAPGVKNPRTIRSFLRRAAELS